MLISILTLFPEMFVSTFDFSIIKHAQEKKLLNLNIVNIRNFAIDKYKTVDDHPYSGGVGMIMKVDVIDRALEFVKAKHPKIKTKSILLDARGKTYNQDMAKDFSQLKHLIIVCGHYEGVDHRVTNLVDDVISIGNYVLTGGEIPAMAIVDSVTRLIGGVLKPIATDDESFTDNEISAPQFTRPEIYKKMSVPIVLLSGDPKKIAAWKKLNSKTIK